jgi:ABC-type multidrug transport system permease subunit
LEEKLDTILKQNSMIIKNIDKLLLFQENLEDRIEDMNSSRSNSNNKTFINVIKSFFNIFITTCLIYAYMLTFSFN